MSYTRQWIIFMTLQQCINVVKIAPSFSQFTSKYLYNYIKMVYQDTHSFQVLQYISVEYFSALYLRGYYQITLVGGMPLLFATHYIA